MVQKLTIGQTRLVNKFWKPFGLRFCRSCGKTQELNAFRHYGCIACHNARGAAYHAAHPDKVRVRSARYRERHPGRQAAYLAGGRDVHAPWPDGAIKYTAAHNRVKACYGSASQYECRCGKPARQWSYDYTCPDELTEHRYDSRNGASRLVCFSPNPLRYTPLCIGCHNQLDIEMATHNDTDHRAAS